MSFLNCGFGFFVKRLSEFEGAVHAVKRDYRLSHVRGRLGWEKKGWKGTFPCPKHWSDFRLREGVRVHC